MYICYDVCVCVSHSKSVFTDADLLMTFANLCLRISGASPDTDRHRASCSDGYVMTMTTTCEDWVPKTCDYSCCPGHSNPTITPTPIPLQPAQRRQPARLYIHTCIHTYILIHIYIYVCTYVCIYVCNEILYIYIYRYIYICMYI